MHITRIELEDIKSHRSSKFEFEKGTTAIMGENGAGKTTLIEAVGWTLFNLLDYKKDDFLRRGAKRGVVRVSFVSGLDEREYTVVRDTGTGYYVHDDQLKARIAVKKEEVERFLWQHLGVEPGTDLEALFRRAIGVPQGTFTAIFLETPTERKKAFDKLLKVEEYRQGAEKLRDTVKYVENQIMQVSIRIARAQGELMRLDQVTEDLERSSELVGQLRERYGTLEKETVERSGVVSKLDETAARVNELKTAFDRLQSEITRAEYLQKQKESEYEQAKAAAGRLASVEPDHLRHLEALGKIHEFERERSERQKLLDELQKTEGAMFRVRADQKVLQESLEKALRAHREAEELRPKIADQEILEKMHHDLIEQVARVRAQDEQIKSLDEKMDDLRAKYTRNKEQIRDAEAKAAAAQDYERLQGRDHELTREISRFRAKLEHDEQFQSEVRNGLCPILSQKCLNLKPGETLEGYLKDQFVELKSQIATLETERKAVAEALRVARDAERIIATLETLKQREAEIAEEGTGYKNEKDRLLAEHGDLMKLQADLQETEAKLRALGNPKARIQMLEEEIRKEVLIRGKLTEIDKNLERLEADRRITTEQLESYKDLDSNWAEYTGIRDATAAAHREFLVNETLARELPERESAFNEATRELSELTERMKRAGEEFSAAGAGYDSELHQNEKTALMAAERLLAETRANLQNAERQQGQAEAEIKRLSEIRQQMQGEFREKERHEKVLETTEFIRATLREAAPRVARNYVYHVSLEANQMFREIMGNAERTLKWTDDYGILLEEAGYDRPFVNLSGGEQMAAALAVRLALLKQLSDIRIAFFDEPTANMDAARRERLAEQVSQITQRQTFDQLFVISHDDTFEGYVDNVVTLESANEK